MVWTGYDDNTPVQLSGASGALPIWTSYMKSATAQKGPSAFAWPREDVTTLSLSPEELVELGIPEEKAIPTVLLSTRPKK